jgi:hypothetical protein
MLTNEEQRAVDTLYLVTLLDELKEISGHIADGFEGLAKTRLDQLRIRISKTVMEMQEREAKEFTNG